MGRKLEKRTVDKGTIRLFESVQKLRPAVGDTLTELKFFHMTFEPPVPTGTKVVRHKDGYHHSRTIRDEETRAVTEVIYAQEAVGWNRATRAKHLIKFATQQGDRLGYTLECEEIRPLPTAGAPLELQDVRGATT